MKKLNCASQNSAREKPNLNQILPYFKNGKDMNQIYTINYI